MKSFLPVLIALVIANSTPSSARADNPPVVVNKSDGLSFMLGIFSLGKASLEIKAQQNAAAAQSERTASTKVDAATYTDISPDGTYGYCGGATDGVSPYMGAVRYDAGTPN